VVVLSQTVALAEACVRLNSGFVEALTQVLVPALKRWRSLVGEPEYRAYDWALAELSAMGAAAPSY
jgi:hypothetical protein